MLFRSSVIVGGLRLLGGCEFPATRLPGDHRTVGHRGWAPSLRLPEIAAAEAFLQQQVQTGEQVTAAHSLDFELGLPHAPVAPGDGNRRPGISPHDGFERKVHGKVEVRRDQRAAAFDDRAH